MGIRGHRFMLKHRPKIQCHVSGIVMAAVQLGERSPRKDTNAAEPFRAREEGIFPPSSSGNFPPSSTLGAVRPWSWVHMQFLTSTTWIFWRVLQHPWKVIFLFSVTGEGFRNGKTLTSPISQHVFSLHHCIVLTMTQYEQCD